MKPVRNDFEQPLSPLSQNLYQEMMKGNEKDVLAEGDPKVTYIRDNNMNVYKFVALGGDTKKKDPQFATFNLWEGQSITLPYEEVQYEIEDTKTGNIRKASVKYLNTTDPILIAKLYKEFYKLAEFLCTQEVALKGLTPAFVDKSAYIADPKTGLPYVGEGYLQNYFGITLAANPFDAQQIAAIADCNRWAFASFNFQIKSSIGVWSSIYNSIKSNDILQYGAGPTVSNIGTNEFDVTKSKGTRNFVPSVAITDTPQYENRSGRSDMANMLLRGQTGINNPSPSPVQPSIQPQPRGPVSGNTKGNTKK